MPFLGTCVPVLAFSRVLCACHGIPKVVLCLSRHFHRVPCTMAFHWAFGAWTLEVWAFQGPGLFRSLAPGRLWLPGTWRWGRFGVAGMAA